MGTWRKWAGFVSLVRDSVRRDDCGRDRTCGPWGRQQWWWAPWGCSSGAGGMQTVFVCPSCGAELSGSGLPIDPSGARMEVRSMHCHGLRSDVSRQKHAAEGEPVKKCPDPPDTFLVTKPRSIRVLWQREGGEAVPDFEEIYQTYFADVYRYVLALSRDAHTAEEVTQETFFRALASIDQFRGDCQLRVWLCQIARNQYLSLCRERKRRGELDREPGDDGHGGRLCGPGRRPAAPPAAPRPAGALQGGVLPADLRGAALRPDRGAVRQDGVLGPGDLLPGEAEIEGGIRWTSWTMTSYRTCCPCTTTACAQRRAGRRWRST